MNSHISFNINLLRLALLMAHIILKTMYSTLFMNPHFVRFRIHRIHAQEHAQCMEGAETHKGRYTHCNLESVNVEDKPQDTTSDDTLPPPL